MTRAELDRFVEMIRGKAAETIVADGFQTALLFLFPPDFEQNPPELVNLTDADLAAVRASVRANGTVAAVVIREALVSGVASPGQGSSRSSDPREAVLVQWEHRMGQAERASGVWFQFFRREGDRVVLEELGEYEGPLANSEDANWLE
jgi:hypothetical protein